MLLALAKDGGQDKEHEEMGGLTLMVWSENTKLAQTALALRQRPPNTEARDRAAVVWEKALDLDQKTQNQVQGPPFIFRVALDESLNPFVKRG